MDLNQTIWEPMLQRKLLRGFGDSLCLHPQFSPSSLDGAHAASKGAPNPREGFSSVRWCSLFSALSFLPCFMQALLYCSFLTIIWNLLKLCLLTSRIFNGGFRFKKKKAKKKNKPKTNGWFTFPENSSISLLPQHLETPGKKRKT